jgi:hypothetical protein
MKKDEKIAKKAIEKVQTYLNENEVPIEILSKNELKVKYDDWQGISEDVITREDVNSFKLDIDSGIATIGNITGDWRQIETIRDDCFEVFRMIDTEIKKQKTK